MVPTGKSKVRAKKPSSKYNEEISSDSETERCVSNEGDTLILWFSVNRMKARVVNVFVAFLFLSQTNSVKEKPVRRAHRV